MPLKLSDILRVAAIFAGAVALSYALPLYDGPSSTTSIFNTMLIFSFLIAFFVNRALERRRTVWRSIEVELSRLRRLYNIGTQISDAEWKARAVAALRKYHGQVAENLMRYDAALVGYREVSKAIYDFCPANRRDEMLWQDMLSTTRDIALERRPLERALVNRITAFSWLVILSVAGSVVILQLMNRGKPDLTELSVGLGLACVLAALDLLRRLDRFSAAEIRRFQDLYLDNLPKE